MIARKRTNNDEVSSSVLRHTQVDTENARAVIPLGVALPRALFKGNTAFAVSVTINISTRDNPPAARPQSGLISADVVIESLAEGGIPRYLAIFTSADRSTRIGPIRSARPYFINRAEEYGGLYVHCGGSPDALACLKLNSRIYDVDELRGAKGFIRDHSRKAPHNLYSTLNELAKCHGSHAVIATKPQSGFISQSELKGMLCTEINIDMSNSHKIAYKYDEHTSQWLRNVNGSSDLALETGHNLSADYVVVQFTHSKVIDDVGRLETNMIGSGDAIIFTDGRAFNCIWEKQSNEATTQFRFGSKSFKFNGRVWIEVVKSGSTNYS
jgi:hypothetical protein